MQRTATARGARHGRRGRRNETLQVSISSIQLAEVGSNQHNRTLVEEHARVWRNEIDPACGDEPEPAAHGAREINGILLIADPYLWEQLPEGWHYVDCWGCEDLLERNAGDALVLGVVEVDGLADVVVHAREVMAVVEARGGGKGEVHAQHVEVICGGLDVMLAYRVVGRKFLRGLRCSHKMKIAEEDEERP